jgi:ankyrin repeat protein
MNSRICCFFLLYLAAAGLASCGDDHLPKKPATYKTNSIQPAATKTDSLLYCAAQNGDLKSVEELLKKHANADARGTGYANHHEDGVDERSGRNWTALMIAAYNHHKDIVQLLLDSGADVNAQNEAGLTPLFYACQANDVGIATCLLNHGAQPNIGDKSGTTPLHWALSYGLPTLAIHLIEKGANVNAINKKYGETALMEAAAYNYHHSVALLIAKGAEVNIIARQSYSALSRAAGNDRDDIRILALLIDQGAAINDDMAFAPLMEAASNGNIRIATLLIEKGADVNAVSKRRGGITALRDAVFACDMAMTRLLVAHGADVKAVTENRSSILLEAVWNEKNLDLVAYLIEQGAQVNLANDDGQTPLLKSVAHKDLAMVRLLLSHGADLSVRDVYGDTVYTLAQESGNEELIQLINKQR